MAEEGPTVTKPLEEEGPGVTKPLDFTIGLCSIGHCKSCCYACCCPHCALAESRSYLDGSDCCFNLVCLPLIPYRWMVRSAYGIGDIDSYCGDICLSACCTLCVINQLYQTTSTLGRPSETAGREYNVQDRALAPDGKCSRCCEACFCMQCAVGSAMRNSMGMPYLLGCCCVNPCLAHNFLRYQYRIATANGDCTDECLFPGSLYTIGLALGLFVPPVWGCVYLGFVSYIMEMDSIVDAKKRESQKGYLIGYTPPRPQKSQKNITVNVTKVVYLQPGEQPPPEGVYAGKPEDVMQASTGLTQPMAAGQHPQSQVGGGYVYNQEPVYNPAFTTQPPPHQHTTITPPSVPPAGGEPYEQYARSGL